MGESQRPPPVKETLVPFLQGCIVAAPALDSWIGLGPASSQVSEMCVHLLSKASAVFLGRGTQLKDVAGRH